MRAVATRDPPNPLRICHIREYPVNDGEVALGAGTVTAGDPGSGLTPSETPGTAFDVATSASAVGGSALEVVPEHGGSGGAAAGAAGSAGGEHSALTTTSAGAEHSALTTTSAEGSAGAEHSTVTTTSAGGEHSALTTASAGGSAAAEKGGFAVGGSGRVREDPEALDLLALAGGSVYRRAIPLGIGVVVVAAVIVWFVARR